MHEVAHFCYSDNEPTNPRDLYRCLSLLTTLKLSYARIILAWLAGCLIGLLAGWWVCFVRFRLVFGGFGSEWVELGLFILVWDC